MAPATRGWLAWDYDVAGRYDLEDLKVEAASLEE